MSGHQVLALVAAAPVLFLLFLCILAGFVGPCPELRGGLMDPSAPEDE